MQADVLHRRPDNAETTGLGREGINLIGALPHIAEETFDRIGRLNVSMHRLRECKKGEGVLFVFSQASDCLRIALIVLGFEGRQLDQGLLLGRLAPDAVEFRLHLASFSPGNGAQQHSAAYATRQRCRGVAVKSSETAASSPS